MNAREKQRPDVQIRWLIRRDMPEVQEIENRSFEYPWSDEDFLNCLRQRNMIGCVAETRRSIYGFMVYELHQWHLRLVNMAVAPEVRRTGVGAAMIERLIDKLSQQRRREIVLDVRESNLHAQLFFSAMGFKAKCSSWKFDNGEGAIQFRYTLPADAPNSTDPVWQGVDRISGFEGL